MPQCSTAPLPSRAVLLGASSVIGYQLALLAPELVLPVVGPHTRGVIAANWRRARLDHPDEWLPLLAQHRAETVIYAHAVCDVGKCQEHPRWAWRANVGNLAVVLAHLPPTCRLVYLSSDHVFGNDGRYCESSLPTPISVYGETRVAAEQLVRERPGSLLLRFGLPIGASFNQRTGFFDWLRYRHQNNLPITIIRDEARSAVWATDLAARILALASSSLAGVRHLPAALVGRPELATFLMGMQGLPASFALAARAEQPHPHLGRVEIASEFDDHWSRPLPAICAPLSRIAAGDLSPEASAKGEGQGEGAD